MSNNNFWRISFDLSNLPIAFNIFGSGLTIKKKGFEKFIYFEKVDRDNPFLVVKDTQITLNTFGGSCPIYLRKKKSIITISNLASLLFDIAQKIEVNNFVILQNLIGLPYPQNNIFNEIELLEASTEYQIKNNTFLRVKSLLHDDRVSSANDIYEYILSKWTPYFSSGVDIAVLCSAGYDSRFNLSIAIHLSKIYGNRIILFHEFKNNEEAEIVKKISLLTNIPLEIKYRDSFEDNFDSLSKNYDFIDSHSGFYRNNILRWHFFLEYINYKYPNCIIMGLGAEAHKGKYYGQIKNIKTDVERVLGVNDSIIKFVAKKAGINNYNPDSQRIFFDKIVFNSSTFNYLHNQIDYAHYQTYVVNGYMHRTHYFLQSFGMKFPLLNNEFLKLVFSLPKKDKKDFFLVKRGIYKFYPNFNKIPYISGNQKSLNKEVSTNFRNIKQIVKKNILNFNGLFIFNLFNKSLKMSKTLSQLEFEELNALKINNQLISSILSLPNIKNKNKYFISKNSLMQISRYFHYHEIKNKITFYS